MTTVWVTRTLPGAEATAERVRTAGFDAFVAPLLEVVFEPGGDIDLSGVTALAFTSANGVRAFAARSGSRILPAFTVGRGTAKAAREVGFAAVTAGDGDVLALARAIPGGEHVLHPGAAEPAVDLVQALENEGVGAKGLVVYRTVSATLSGDQRERAAACDYVLLQSAKAAHAFRDLNYERVRPICLSDAVGRVLPCCEKTIAAAPTEDALIGALIEDAR